MNNVFQFSSGYRKFCNSWWKHWFSWQTYFNPLKHSYQRITKGWADCDTWSLDNYLASILPEALIHLKEHKHGIPCSMFEPDDTNCENWELAEKKWNGIMDKMIAGFQAAYVKDNPNYDDFMEDCPGTKNILGELTNKKLNVDKLHEWEDEQLKIFNEGMDLFKEHFFSLWD